VPPTLSAYGGESDDLPREVLQRHLDGLAAGTTSPGPIRVNRLEEIGEAHADLEQAALTTSTSSSPRPVRPTATLPPDARPPGTRDAGRRGRSSSSANCPTRNPAPVRRGSG
jgi:hypothetical protein